MSLKPAYEAYIRAMPKVELHVHLEGSIQPETLLELAKRNRVHLPYETVEGLREWYRFRDFPHFVESYVAISSCLCRPDDIELIAREFLIGQAAQNIRYSEVTYTPFTIYRLRGIAFEDQLGALNRARNWAEKEFGVTMQLILDIAREIPPEDGLVTAEWVIASYGSGVCALGLGGHEAGNPPEKFRQAFDRVHAAGVPAVPHAGETGDSSSIWGALRALNAVRIGHGVRCLEDPPLVDELRFRQIPLEICPTSNVCLKVASSFSDHPLPRLLNAGLYVTLNSDDPPMFNTTLTDEYLNSADSFGFEPDILESLSLNAVRAALLPESKRALLEKEFRADFKRLREEYNL